MSNIQNLKTRAQGIQGETAQGQNTADRVGGLLVDMCSELGTVEDNLTIINNKIIQGGGGDTVEVLPETISSPNKLVATIKINGTPKYIYAPSNSGTTPGPSGSGANYVTNVSSTGFDDGTEIGKLIVESKVYSNGVYSDGISQLPIKVSANDIKPLVAQSVSWNQVYTAEDSQKQLIGYLKVGDANPGTAVYAPKGSGSGGVSSVEWERNGSYTTSIGWLKVNGSRVAEVFAPSGSGTTPTPTPEGYSKKEIDEKIRQAEEDMRQHFEDIIDGEDADMNAWVQSLLDGYNFIDGHSSGWNDQLNKYLQNVGLLELNEDGTVKTKKWSYIEQGVDYINQAVNEFNRLSGNNYEALGTLISQKIANDAAIIDLRARYATGSELDGILQWMSSGLDLQSSDKKTFAQLWSAAKDTATNSSAIAGLRTSVETIEGNYVATTELGTLVKHELDWTQAGITVNGTLDNALADLFAKDSSGARSSIAAVVEDGVSTIMMTADFINAVAGRVDINAGVIEQVANSICLKMDNLAIVSGADGNKKGAVFTIPHDNSGNPLGFEIAVGDVKFNNDGTWNSTSSMVGKYRFTYYYAWMPKILSYNILLANPGTDGSVPTIDVPSKAQIRWFASINNDGNGDQFGYTNGVKNQELGHIEFNGGGINISAHVNITGSLTVNGNTIG